MIPTRIDVFMHFLLELSTLSKCEDKKQAAIITDNDCSQIYSIGLNGGPKHGAQCLCKLGGKYTCIHAEAQAIAKCTVTDSSKIMFCTMSPCVTCASLIVNTGFSKIFYVNDYKDSTGLQILRDANITIRKWRETNGTD